MSNITIRTGFHPEVKREYNGEHIYSIVGERTLADTKFYRVSNGVWIKDLGGDKYVTDWTAEERWGHRLQS